MSVPAVLDIVNNWPPLAAMVTDGTQVKVYPDTVPEGVAMPYIAYLLSTVQPIAALNGYPDADYVRLSFECYAKERADALTLADALRDAFDHGGKNGRPLGYLITGMLEQYEPETRSYFVAMEWGLWQGRNDTPGGIAPDLP